jgi:hypothetical protein
VTAQDPWRDALFVIPPAPVPVDLDALVARDVDEETDPEPTQGDLFSEAAS